MYLGAENSTYSKGSIYKSSKLSTSTRKSPLLDSTTTIPLTLENATPRSSNGPKHKRSKSSLKRTMCYTTFWTKKTHLQKPATLIWSSHPSRITVLKSSQSLNPIRLINSPFKRLKNTKKFPISFLSKNVANSIRKTSNSKCMEVAKAHSKSFNQLKNSKTITTIAIFLSVATPVSVLTFILPQYQSGKCIMRFWQSWDSKITWSANFTGGIFTSTLPIIIRGFWKTSNLMEKVSSRSSTKSSGKSTKNILTLGSKAELDFRSSTQQCGKWTQVGTCTTDAEWSQRVSFLKTCSSTGDWASNILRTNWQITHQCRTQGAGSGAWGTELTRSLTSGYLTHGRSRKIMTRTACT